MVSVIVPIYNTAKYLSECIESIINQTYKDVEILLVDDGSTDASQEICFKYSKIDSRIKYIKKKNGGVSSTRNEGLRNAKGEYVVFVDSDDYLERSIISSAVKKINETNADMLGWNTWIVRGSEIKKSKDIKFCQEDFCYIQAALVSGYTKRFYCGDLVRAVWGKLLKKSVIDKHNISFYEKLYIGEDAVFLVEYISHIKKAVFINEFGYYYRILQNSAVRRYKSDLYEQSMMQMSLLKKLVGCGEGAMKIDDINKNSLYVLQWTLLRNLFDNDRISDRATTNYSDVYKWYEYMKKSQLGERVRAPWVGKLLQVQMFFGTNLSIHIHIMLMKMSAAKTEIAVRMKGKQRDKSVGRNIESY